METSERFQVTSLSGLIWSAEGTPVSRLAKPGSEPENQIRGIFGRSSRDYFAFLDRGSCSWKTSQATLLSGLDQFSETWPDSGTMRNGRVYELQSLERPTCESASSSWPTARGEDGESAGNHPGAMDSLTGVTRNWSTAAAHDGRRPGSDATSTQGANLTSTDSFRSRGGDRVDEMGLDQQARFFPTPASRDYRTPNKQTYRERRGKVKGEQLQNFVEHSPLVPTIPDGELFSPSIQTSPRRLNPQFVEWLMGFPIGWSKR